MKERWVIHVRTFQYPFKGGGAANIRGIPESERLRVTPPNLDTIFTFMNLQGPLQGGSEHTQRFAESEQLRVKPPNLDTILTLM